MTTYTNDQIRSFHAEYLEIGTKSIPDFAKSHGLKSNNLWRRFKKLGLEIIPQEIVRRKFPIDDKFFEIIDNEEKAYVLGFLYADGCNYETNHNVCISLQKSDIDILETISKLLLHGNTHIKIDDEKGEARLDFINQKLSDDLKKLGCVARKTFVLKFPELPLQLQHHFIRGYFDGDGMLVLNQRPNSSYKEADFSITSTMEMIETISQIFEKFNIYVGMSKRHKDRDNNNYTLRVSGNQQIKKVCDFLYKDATIFLERKHQLYLELCVLSKLFRVSDEDFISTFNKLKDKKLVGNELNISRKTVERRMKKMNLRSNE